jgi:hypothetical protein
MPSNRMIHLFSLCHKIHGGPTHAARASAALAEVVAQRMEDRRELAALRRVRNPVVLAEKRLSRRSTSRDIAGRRASPGLHPCRCSSAQACTLGAVVRIAVIAQQLGFFILRAHHRLMHPNSIRHRVASLPGLPTRPEGREKTRCINQAPGSVATGLFRPNRLPQNVKRNPPRPAAPTTPEVPRTSPST